MPVAATAAATGVVSGLTMTKLLLIGLFGDGQKELKACLKYHSLELKHGPEVGEYLHDIIPRENHTIDNKSEGVAF